MINDILVILSGILAIMSIAAMLTAILAVSLHLIKRYW
jgi:hypothetical protein